jgi:hypothetical protein
MGDKGAVELTEASGCYFTQEPWAKKLTDEEKAKALEEAAAIAEAVKSMSKEEAEAYKVTNSKSRLEGNDALKGVWFAAEGNETTADVHQFRAFAQCIKSKTRPRTNEMVGLGATIVSLAALKAIKEGVTVDIDPAWSTFDFEAPSAIDYDTEVKAIENVEEPAKA